MNPPFRLLSAFAVALIAFVSGCATPPPPVAPAPAPAVYERGELVATLDAGFDRALRAARQASEQLQLVTMSEKQEAALATLVARNGDDKRIEIRVQPAEAGRSTVTIRIGIVGEEPLAQAILARIRSNL